MCFYGKFQQDLIKIRLTYKILTFCSNLSDINETPYINKFAINFRCNILQISKMHASVLHNKFISCQKLNFCHRLPIYCDEKTMKFAR